MTLSTRTISLSEEWQQIANGTENIFIQVKSGGFEYVFADVAPLSETEGHPEGAGFKCIFTPPTQVWGRAIPSVYVKKCSVVVSVID